MSQITSLESYFIDPSVGISAIRKGGRSNSFQIVTFDDRSEWVVMTDKGNERFCGYLYLKNALEKAGSSKVKAAENKLFWDKGKVYVLSRYCGEKKLEMKDLLSNPNYIECLKLIDKVHFSDTLGFANLRKEEDKIYVFDTEKNSFASSVHEKIDEMEGTRAKIEKLLIQKVSGVEQPESKHGERSNSPANNSSNTP